MQTAVLHQLLQQQLQAGQPVQLRVSSNSMRPLLKAGDQIIIQHIAITALKAGDIITVCQADSLLTHRLVEVDTASQQLILRGEWQKTPDGPVPFSAYLGKVAQVRKGNGRVLSPPLLSIISIALFLVANIKRLIRP